MRTNKVKQLVINAMLAAICFVLAYFSLTFVNIKFTFESIPVHLGALFFGPAAGMAIGGIGTFLYQVLSYGVTVTTVLWIVPYILCGGFVGFVAKWKNFSLTRIQAIGLMVTGELIITLMNTGALYIDSQIYGYYHPTLITGVLALRLLICVIKAVAYWPYPSRIGQHAPACASAGTCATKGVLEMTPQEAVAYIENYTWSASRLGLERTRELLHALGDPQKQLKFIHVAGSNGKGSTCAMLESILRCAGYRTGLYISPYIQQFCERIQIGGHNIPGERLAAITEQVQTIADHMADHPSQFELVTAIAMVYFQQEHCDIVVLEVGMGGALDSTNVIDAPEVAVITNIGLEHTEYLGSTLAEIALHQGGPHQTGRCTVCYDGAPEVTQVIAQVCREKGVPMHLAKWGTVKPLDHGLHGQRFAWREQEYLLPLLGEHQLRNAAVVLETILALLRRGWNISEGAVREGLAPCGMASPF